MQLSDLGLVLDLVAVFLLAKYALPSEPLYADGRELFQVSLEQPRRTENINKYITHRTISSFAYKLLALGFALQLSPINDAFKSLLNNM